jgi:hypothetical protein
LTKPQEYDLSLGVDHQALRQLLNSIDFITPTSFNPSFFFAQVIGENFQFLSGWVHHQSFASLLCSHRLYELRSGLGPVENSLAKYSE